jgi:hypothetical protein
MSIRSIPVAVPPKEFVCDRLILGIADSNNTTGMDVHMLCLYCAVYLAASATS